MTMIKYMLNDISEDMFKKIMLKNIFYRDTDKMDKQEPMLKLEYEDSISEAIEEVKQSIELKSMNVGDIVVKICEFLEQNKDEMLLKKADRICVVINGLSNISFVNKNNPRSGKSILINVQDVLHMIRVHLKDEDDRKQEETSLRNFKIMCVCTLSLIFVSRYLL